MTARHDDARRRLGGQIDTALRARGAPRHAEHERAYLKSELTHYGTSVPAIRSVAKDQVKLAACSRLGHHPRHAAATGVQPAQVGWLDKL